MYIFNGFTEKANHATVSYTHLPVFPLKYLTPIQEKAGTSIPFPVGKALKFHFAWHWGWRI